MTSQQLLKTALVLHKNGPTNGQARMEEGLRALSLTAELFPGDRFREKGSMNSVYPLVSPPLVTKMALNKLNGPHNRVSSHESGRAGEGQVGKRKG